MNKLPKTRANILSLCLISVSLSGLFLLAALTFGVPTSKTGFSWQKSLIGSIFGAICLLGIISGAYPSKCTGMLHFQKKIQNGRHNAYQESVGERGTRFKGHHPRCGNFSAHVLRLGGKEYCAGCTGLVIGAIMALLGTLMYLFTTLFLGEVAVALFWLGFAGVALGLLQYNLLIHRSLVHLSLNVIFVVGALLLLIGIEEITRNLALETYFVALTLYWILTRILLSQQEHRRICAACGLKSCRFLE